MTYVPTVHLNGTAKQELVDQQVAVINAGRELLLALQAARPNGRDYILQAASNLEQAHAENETHWLAVNSMITEFGNRAIAIDEQ